MDTSRDDVAEIRVDEPAENDLDELAENDLAEIDLDELTAFALAADPDAPIPDDAIPFTCYPDGAPGALLPSWYMPAPGGSVRVGRGWRRVVAITVIAAFLAVDAVGLCSTYGWITLG
jgi:hypothetical protein